MREALGQLQVAAFLQSEQAIDFLAHVVDDVHPRDSRAEDIEDARRYCQAMARTVERNVFETLEACAVGWWIRRKMPSGWSSWQLTLDRDIPVHWKKFYGATNVECHRLYAPTLSPTAR